MSKITKLTVGQSFRSTCNSAQDDYREIFLRAARLQSSEYLVLFKAYFFIERGGGNFTVK